MTKADDYLIHGLLIVILVTGFVIEGSRMAVTEVGVNDALARWSPVRVAGRAGFGSVSDATLVTLHRVLWWLHFALVVAFIAIIPFTKLRHLFTTPVNYLLRPHGPTGLLTPLDLEDETAEQFGAAHVADLRWKDIYDADACTACKRCQDRCPAWSTGKPLSPMKVVQQIGDVAFLQPQAELAEAISADAIWACTTCRACQEICPAEIEHVEKIVALRRNLVLMEGAFAGEEVERAARSTEMSGNPLGMPGNARADWADGLNVPVVPSGEPLDVLYFAGCYASFDPRNQRVAKAFIDHLPGGGGAGRHARRRREVLRRADAQARQRVPVPDAGGGERGDHRAERRPPCRRDLPALLRDAGPRLPRARADGRGRASRDLHQAAPRRPAGWSVAPSSLSVTYHDSCYLGRYMDVYGEPREVLSALGADVSEMSKHGRESFCCGGGGGRVLTDERLGTRISHARVAQAQETGAAALVSNCPFCLTMFEDAISSLDCGETLQARDLAEVVAARLEAPTAAPAGVGDVSPAAPAAHDHAM